MTIIFLLLLVQYVFGDCGYDCEGTASDNDHICEYRMINSALMCNEYERYCR